MKTVTLNSVTLIKEYKREKDGQSWVSIHTRITYSDPKGEEKSQERTGFVYQKQYDWLHSQVDNQITIIEEEKEGKDGQKYANFSLPKKEDKMREEIKQEMGSDGLITNERFEDIERRLKLIEERLGTKQDKPLEITHNELGVAETNEEPNPEPPYEGF